jgi:hypothetical protein
MEVHNLLLIKLLYDLKKMNETQNPMGGAPHNLDTRSLSILYPGLLLYLPRITAATTTTTTATATARKTATTTAAAKIAF